MIKVIIFDADGVMIHNPMKFSENLAKQYGISLERTKPFFNGPFQDCLVGDKDLKESISPFLEGWGWDQGVDKFLDFWFESEHNVNQELVNYIQELRGSGVKCLLATNNEKHRFNYILDKMGFASCFDGTYTSAHLGYKKPDHEFFNKILKELGDIQKNEVLFVDDDEENIKSGLSFGFNVELYSDIENLKTKVSDLA